jgi:predicted PurR-regulated permease PerM
MNENHRNLISMLLTLLIIGLTLFILHRFLSPLIWAAIIAMASFPLYQLWENVCQKRKTLASLSLTIVITLIIAIPISWLVTVLIDEIQLFVHYLIKINAKGEPVPGWLTGLPFVGHYLAAQWQELLSKPNGISKLLSGFHLSFTPGTQLLKTVGVSMAHRTMGLAFTLLCLFFFYRDGNKLSKQVHHLGEECLGKRWGLYAHGLPAAIRATVNGTVFVGLGVGVLMGIAYALAGVTASVLLGFITGILAMVPFAAPIVYIVVALVLVGKGSVVSAILVVVWGIVVMFVADHFVKPMLIGNATRLPFLAVLFGILGGIETLGLIGLFVGPIIMVFFMTLWREPQSENA